MTVQLLLFRALLQTCWFDVVSLCVVEAKVRGRLENERHVGPNLESLRVVFPILLCLNIVSHAGTVTCDR